MQVRIVGAAEKTTMTGVLILSGTVALIVGLAAVIAGNLQRFGIMRRSKNEPSSPH
jgi:hypothetical protein